MITLLILTIPIDKWLDAAGVVEGCYVIWHSTLIPYF